VIAQLLKLGVFGESLSWKGLSEARKRWKVVHIGMIQDLLKEGKLTLDRRIFGFFFSSRGDVFV
jgi:hypothetical protein